MPQTLFDGQPTTYSDKVHPDHGESARSDPTASIREIDQPSRSPLHPLWTTSNFRAATPDGKYIASVVSEAGKQSIHIMELATSSDLRIVQPSGTGFSGLAFSNDSDYLYYLENQTETGILYRVSKLGGGQRKLLAGVNTPASFSPDGNQIAFVRHNTSDDTPELIVAQVDGTLEKSLPNGLMRRRTLLLIHRVRAQSGHQMENHLCAPREACLKINRR